ncbi:MAG: prolyl oligopeptidase family serine peptidase [Calditrichaeota bacterium]|nr:prolyl oligopeptidase family serine peptidase [Calditrichota bacterium]
MKSLLIILFTTLSVLSLSAREEWTVKHVLQQESITEITISPDGQKLVWVKRYPDFEKDRYLTDLFLTLLSSPKKAPEIVQLTRTGNNRSPRWSPDGRWIAFISNRELPGKDKKNLPQVWLLDTYGGEPYPLTRLETSVQRFAWLDSNTIVFTARENKTYYEQELKKKKDDAIVVEDTTLFWPVRLFRIDVQSKKIQRLTHNRFQIGEFAPSPDGKYIVYTLNRTPITADARIQPKQYLLQVETGKVQEIFPGRYFDPSGFQWRRDGQGFFASDVRSSDPENEGAGILELYYFDIPSMRHEKIPLQWDWAVGFAGYAVAGNGVHVQLAAGPRFKPRYYYKEGNRWKFVEIDHSYLPHSTSISIGPNGQTIAFDYSRPDEPPRYFVARYRQGTVDSAQEFVKLNEYLKTLPIPRAEVIEWKGYGGETVNGILYYPLDFQPGKRYPLMVVIHGGPSGVDLDAWRLGWTVYAPIWAQKGAFVLRPNYHGSGNHGLKFVESIKGRYYELELPDIVKGIQHLIRRGWVHPDSLGVMGWSNGAILTIALTVEYPDMFRAAAPGAGDVNWISDYGNCAFGVRFDNSYFLGPPWKYLNHYIEKSPLFRMERVKTPTIIFFGTEDRAVPTEQGWQHYRALQQIGKVPVRFVLFPDEPHGFRRLSHQKRKMEEEIAWFDLYLFGKTHWKKELEKRVLPETAPLALLPRIKAIQKVKGLYGVTFQSWLLPEMVTLNDSLRVSRFEITRAQFRAFRPDYPVPAGTENYPANHIRLEDARAYVRWLSEITGRSFRLPTIAEMEQLIARAGKQENNLAYWLGYTPNLDEYQSLRERLQTWNADDLLMPVGSRPPGNIRPNAPLLFDLDGNVAEWAIGKDESGKAMGASAVTIKDARVGDYYPVPPEFIGFRVVEDIRRNR